MTGLKRPKSIRKKGVWMGSIYYGGRIGNLVGGHKVCGYFYIIMINVTTIK